MVGTMQPKVLVEFYGKVIGKAPDMSEGGWSGWMVGSAFFSVGEHSEMEGPAKDAGRVMFNFETETVKEDFERIKAVPGAKVVKEPYAMGDNGMWIATLADPDGNLFQLMTPWKDEK